LVGPAGASVGSTGIFNLILDGGGSALETGMNWDITLMHNLKINHWRVVSSDGTTGTLRLNVAKDSYANFYPTGLMHPGVTGPLLVNSDLLKRENSDLSAWTSPTGMFNDQMRVSVVDVKDIKKATVTFTYSRY
jgi:hypothetical protein